MEQNHDVLSNEPVTPVAVGVKALPAINYALHHNGIAAVQIISITNNTDSALENLDVELRSSPEFMLPFTRHIDCIPAQKTVEISRPKVILNGEFLAGMTERITGILTVSVSREGQTLASAQMETSVLAFDQWNGLGLYPELLAAFITPNHPQITGIIARASKFLGQWTGDTSLDAYQSQDPNRVVHQAAAVFSALKEQAIAYAVNPASYETAGQRVRLCDEVLGQKLGTCLDLTLLYAECLEAIGLHPLLIVKPGHIFTGLWLEEKMFPESVQDDGSQVTKRLASGVSEIAVVETTFITTGADHSFDDARVAAEQSFTKSPVECIIDVRRARLSGIVPLPQRVHTDLGWHIEEVLPVHSQPVNAPSPLTDPVRLDPNEADCALPKKMQWERKLLDLGTRNTLINLRLTKTQLPILTNSLDSLEDGLASGGDFSITPRPKDWQAGDISFETLHAQGSSRLIEAEFQNKRLRTIYTEGELAKIIKNLYRTAKTSLEENGANTLYLAVGMLRWFESKRSTKPRYAPIVLLPVEMVRKSAAQGYVIRLRDDEPQMNITLLEKLKQDFGITVNGVDPLPVDEHGIDIRKVLTIMRKAVMEQPHWDVVEAATIGIFSFSQFVMWNDIRSRTEDLMCNKIVHSLMEGRLTWEAEPMEIGSRVEESGVLLPMAADASQLYAIQEACSGKSFVLHGPPGTGKSQTITSMIANALAQGKSVLFVAEKMAALEVVQKRLEKIGIGPFCLELHSNKSKKKYVLEQLRRASEVTKQTPAEDFAARAEEIAAQRMELDGYAQQLHEIRACGMTLYDLINQYESYANGQQIEPFTREFAAKLDRRAAAELDILVQRLIAAAQEVGHPHNHPLKPVRCRQYTQTLRTSLPGLLYSYQKEILSLAPGVSRLVEVLEEPPIERFEDLKNLADTAADLLFWLDVPRCWTQAENPPKYFDEIMRMARHHQRAHELRQELLKHFQPEFLSQNGKQLLADLTQSSEKWFLARMVGTNKIAGRVRNFAKSQIEKESLLGHLTRLRDYQSEQRAAEALFAQYGSDLGELYDGENTHWDFVAQRAEEARHRAQAIYNTWGTYDFLRRRCADPRHRELAEQVWHGYHPFAEAREQLDDLLKLEHIQSENWMEGQLELCKAIADHSDSLKEWITFTEICRKAEKQGLNNVAAAYQSGMAHDAVFPAYKKALLFALISDAIDDSDELNAFSGAVFNEKIEQYKRADREWTELSRREVYCRLSAKVPNFTREAAQSSELGILQRCIKSGGRGTSIRKLFDQLPNLLPRLCPCMLMSPISAAQYLDPKREPFDLVIFDEASQLPTCKAVGVLARGKNAVIVGDPKQMPPTAFFTSNTVDEDNMDIEDLESILDDCLALNMPQTHLLWHYRSRHESLIAFSNSQFYENKLYTFPSVNDRESKVRLVPVDGFFDRGKGRRNQAEAEAVLADLKRRCHDPKLYGQSVGVVTFNIQQQNLIDDMLNEACAKDPALEKWAFGTAEPLFIKNLENVQGDERDVILFSIGYGPDENGRVYMNFGPLNRDGGWRRLNVAISRARYEMVVFSALRPDQIDLNRTKADGVAALRAFLEYAQGRDLALNEGTLRTGQKTEDGIARAICVVLAEKGYNTDLQVGRSAYRIDIGVIDPRNPERYILGIMLDGSGYGGAKTTRDREIAQISVLNGLGWEITRVWCMDWWDNQNKEIKRILALLDKLQTGEEDTGESSPEIPTEAPEPAVPVSAAISVRLPQVYAPAALTAAFIPTEYFTEDQYVDLLRAKIRAVVDVEAPVSAGLLIRRVVQSCGIARAGSRIQSHMDELLAQMNLKSTQQDDMAFYWKDDQEPGDYIGLRAGSDGESRRDVRELPIQEIGNAVHTVLLEQIGMVYDDLIRETAKKLGYTRLGGNVIAAISAGLQYALDQGGILLGANGAYGLTEAGTARAEAVVSAFRSETIATSKASARKMLSWEEFYDKIGEWSESTLSARIPSIADLGPNPQIVEAIQRMGSESCALKLLKRAVELGAQFTVEDAVLMESYLNEKGALFLVDRLQTRESLGSAAGVKTVIECFRHRAAAQALYRRATEIGVHFTQKQKERIMACIAE